MKLRAPNSYPFSNERPLILVDKEALSMKNKTNPKTVGDVLTLTEAAALAGVSDGTMYRFVRSERVPALPTASPRDKILIPRANLVTHLDGLAAEAQKRARAARKK